MTRYAVTARLSETTWYSITVNNHSERDYLTSARYRFKLLILYRWMSLIPVVLSLVVGETGDLIWVLSTLVAATSVNLVITLFPTQLNNNLLKRPWFLAVDLIFCAALTGLTGGWNTPYALYTLSPLLAAAFFFDLRGALLSAIGMAGLYVLAGLATASPDPDWLGLVARVAEYLLIAGAFGYAASLVTRLQTSHVELNRTHRDLKVIHGLTVSLQSATDVNEVEERVLEAVTSDLGYPQAIVALVDQSEGIITAWLGKARDGQAVLAGSLPHPARVPLAPEGGLIAQSLLDSQVRLSAAELRTPDDRLNVYLGTGPYHVFPMVLREHPVGVLLVDATETSDSARLQSLHAIASQAAVALGTTLLCVDRAQRLAVQDERIRIARDIHDTVSQSLFGITYSLDGCVKMLPEQPEAVKKELAGLLTLAQSTRDEVRQSILDIWPSDLTAERFAGDLRRYMSEACRASQLDLAIEVRGDFSVVSQRAKRSLYRITQAALNNVVRHAAAHHAWVCLDIVNDQAMLSVRDDGRGFDPSQAMAREFNRERFGLLGISDRVTSLGGTTEILSRLGTGTTVLVTVPVVTKVDGK